MKAIKAFRSCRFVAQAPIPYIKWAASLYLTSFTPFLLLESPAEADNHDFFGPLIVLPISESSKRATTTLFEEFRRNFPAGDFHGNVQGETGIE